MKIHDKLVRDKIPDICEADGHKPHVRIIDDDQEFLGALCNKLTEETKEVNEDPCLEELADTLEVVYSIGKALGYTPEQIEAARAQKAVERGGFDHRIFLISTD